MNKTYYYLHTNGQLIEKNAYVVDSLGPDEYFEGGFVVKWWVVNTKEEFERVEEEADKLRKEIYGQYN